MSLSDIPRIVCWQRNRGLIKTKEVVQKNGGEMIEIIIQLIEQIWI